MTVKRGSVAVKIYHTPTSEADGWTLVYREADGTRKRVFRAQLDTAETEAEKVATRLSNTSSAVALLTDDEASQAVTARDYAARAGRPLLVMAQEYYDLQTRLGGKGTLPLAVDYYLQHHKDNLLPISTKDAVANLLRARELDGLGDRHLLDLKNRLAVFATHFQCDIAEINSQMIEDWLRITQEKRDWSGRTRNHYRAAISNLLHYAKARGHLPRDWNEMEFVAKATEADGEIGVYTPEDMVKLLKAGPDKDLLPFVVLSGFAGMRPSEVLRLDWSDFHWTSEELFIGEGKVRTAGHRVAPLLPNCVAWMNGIRQEKGPITRLVDFSHPLQELRRSAGVASVHDGLRHSYISYRRAITKNLPLVSSETGTDEDTLTKRYCRPVSLNVAEAWFAIKP